MTRIQCRQYVLEIYQEFYREVYIYDNYLVHVDDIVEKMVQNFIDYLDRVYGLDKIGLDFLVKWIEINFDFRIEKTDIFSHGDKKIMLSWIIGKTSIERYEKNKDWLFTYKRFNRKIRKTVHTRILEKFKEQLNPQQIIKQKQNFIDIKQYEENEKQRFHNKAKGLAWCIMNTTLYNHISEYCLMCNYREDCKKLLKTNYPKLFKIRKYD